MNALGGMLSENDDLDFSLELIDHIDAAYKVDRSRVHVTGWSMGAAMAYDMACAFPDQVASVAGVANPMAEGVMDTCASGRAMAFLMIHGTADPIIPFEGLEGGGYVFSRASETPSFWADRNDCSPNAQITELEDVTTDDNSTVTLIEYAECGDDTEVLFYQVNNGGHTWPGGSFPGGSWPEFLGPVNQDISASAEIWDFFARNPHPMDINEMIQVCHVPPGNPSNARTITVSANALPAHLAHGDTEGPCGDGV